MPLGIAVPTIIRTPPMKPPTEIPAPMKPKGIAIAKIIAKTNQPIIRHKTPTINNIGIAIAQRIASILFFAPNPQTPAPKANEDLAKEKFYTK